LANIGIVTGKVAIMSKKRAYIIHGWGGNPQQAWIPWLKRSLESKGVSVVAPQMPDEEHPRIDLWVGFLDGLVIDPDEETFFIGHSIGCQAILRYLQILPQNVVVGGALFVAGWFNLENLESPEEERIAEQWITQPIYNKKVCAHSKKIITLISDNDPFGCKKENIDRFQELGSQIIELKQAGHIEEQELQEALTALEQIGILTT